MPPKRAVIRIRHEYESGLYDNTLELWKDVDHETRRFLTTLERDFADRKWPDEWLDRFSKLSAAKRDRNSSLKGCHITDEFDIRIVYANTRSIRAEEQSESEEEEEEEEESEHSSDRDFIEYEDEEEEQRRVPISKQEAGGAHSEEEEDED